MAPPRNPKIPYNKNINQAIMRANLNERFSNVPKPAYVPDPETARETRRLLPGGTMYIKPGSLNIPAPRPVATHPAIGSVTNVDFGAPVDTSPAPILAPPPGNDNPFPGAYDKLLAYIKAEAASRPREYDSMGRSFKAEHDQADQGMYDRYQGSRAGTDASAVALGVDPLVVSAARDLAMRKNQENSDHSLADNLAWLHKAGMLSEQQAQASGVQYAAEGAAGSAKWQADEQQRIADLQLATLQAQLDAKIKAAGSGGGGGGRGGGGSGGSSSGDAKVAESSVLATGGVDIALYQELARTDPEAAAAYLNMLNLTGTPGQKMAQQKINDLTALANYHGTIVKPKPHPGSINLIGNALNNIGASAHNAQTMAHGGVAASASMHIPIFQKVLDAMTAISGNQGNPRTTVTIKRNGRGD